MPLYVEDIAWDLPARRPRHEPLTPKAQVCFNSTFGPGFGEDERDAFFQLAPTGRRGRFLPVETTMEATGPPATPRVRADWFRSGSILILPIWTAPRLPLSRASLARAIGTCSRLAALGGTI